MLNVIWYPPSWRGRPREMTSTDFTLWLRWIAAHADEWDDYAYDVELPAGAAPPPGEDKKYIKLWKRVTAKRIDVLGRRAGGMTIFEVRQRAAWQTLGQVLGYSAMFQIAHPEERVEQIVIITDQLDPGLAVAAGKYGVALALV